MKCRYNPLYLIFFVLTISCAGLSIAQKENSESQPQGTKTDRPAQREMFRLGQGGRDYVPGEILIRFADGTDDRTIETIQRELHLKTIRIVSRPNLYLMKILDGSSVEEVMERLQGFQEVVYSEPNFRRRAH